MTQVQIFIDKDDLIDSRYVYSFLLKLLLDQNISGATVFKGWMGFGKNHVLKKPDDILSFDEPPLLITFIDEDPKAEAAIQAIRKEYSGGVIVKSKVELL